MGNKLNGEKEIYFVIGTRAQFIKVAPLMALMRTKKVPYKLIFTQQHKETIDEILETYDLPKPDYVLYSETEANTMGRFLSWFIKVFYEGIFKGGKYLKRGGIVLTHGDTFTTWLAALMGKLHGCKVGHLESGLRSFNLLKPFPEEISRLITFSLTDVYFCSSDWAVDNLKRYKGVKINMKMNPLYDGVMFALRSHKKQSFDFFKKNYILVSIHRYENIFTNRFTDFIIPQIIELSKSFYVVITLHPTTRERLKSIGKYDLLANNKNILMHERFNFVDFINVLDKSQFVVSDGGSNQEELSYLGVPTILFRDVTERKEGLEKNIVLSEYKIDVIENFVKNYKKFRTARVTADCSPNEIVLKYLEEYISA